VWFVYILVYDNGIIRAFENGKKLRDKVCVFGQRESYSIGVYESGLGKGLAH
jgi:hypothetical protein